MDLASLAFRLRTALHWSLPAFKQVLTRARARALYDGAARDRFDALEARFPLEAWERCCAEQDWRESLYVLDVGAKNGAMLAGLITATGRDADAVELDAHRRSLWGSTRRVYGESIAAAFPGSRFIAGDVRSLEGPWALATWWLPFLSEAPLEAWGLPRQFLRPRELLEHVVARVVPGGGLLIVNQGEAEAALQGQLFEAVGLMATSLGRVDSPLSPFTRPRHGWWWRRPLTAGGG